MLPDERDRVVLTLFRRADDTNYLARTARMDTNPEASVVNSDYRSCGIPNLWVCNGSIFQTTGGLKPSLTITGIAMHTTDRIRG